jgi:hypothetical protein
VSRRLIVTAIAAIAAGTVAVAPAADAKPKPKPFSKTVSVTDPTPDPTGGAVAGTDICKGNLPNEAPVSVAIPAAGKLKADISGFQGDWAIAIRDKAGNFLTGDDENPPATEALTFKVKKAGTYLVQACNLGGTPMADLHYSYTPA